MGDSGDLRQQVEDEASSLVAALADANAMIRDLARQRDAWRRTAIDSTFHVWEGGCPGALIGATSRDPTCPGCCELEGLPAPDRTICRWDPATPAANPIDSRAADDTYSCNDYAASHDADGCMDEDCGCPLTPQQVADRWGTLDLPPASAVFPPAVAAGGATPPAGASGGSEPRPEPAPETAA